MRPVSLAVDVTNYVMLELGQPLHAFDRTRLQGADRRTPGRAGREARDARPRDARRSTPRTCVITDDRGPIGLAGDMGGARRPRSTPASTDAGDRGGALRPGRRSPGWRGGTSCPARRPGGSSAASTPSCRRSRRPGRSQLLARARRRAAHVGSTEVDRPARRAAHRARPGPPRPHRRAADRGAGRCVRRLEQVGCAVDARRDGAGRSRRRPGGPTSRDPADLDEEVIRLVGYEHDPLGAAAGARRAAAGPSAAAAPPDRPGAGRTPATSRRRATRSSAAADLDALGLAPDDDPRRRACGWPTRCPTRSRCCAPRCCPGCSRRCAATSAAGTHDVALFEVGPVFRPGPGTLPAAPRPPVDRRPTEDGDRRARRRAAGPAAPRRRRARRASASGPAGGAPAGPADLGRRGRGRPRWSPARPGRAGRARADEHAPWHPGRCAALRARRQPSSATPASCTRGSSRPWACPSAPARWSSTSTLLGADTDPVPAPRLSTYPAATQDVALVVDATVPAADVEAALRDGAGELLESVRLFDVYRGAQVGEGKASLAYALRFRAPDRTLTVEEATAARDAAVAEAPGVPAPSSAPDGWPASLLSFQGPGSVRALKRVVQGHGRVPHRGRGPAACPGGGRGAFPRRPARGGP